MAYTHNQVCIHLMNIVLIAIIISVLSPSIAAVSLEEFSMQSLTSSSKELHESPSFAVHGGNIHIVWNTWHDEFTSQVYYRRSFNNGNTWEPPVKLNQNTSIAFYPVVAVYDTTVHVMWKDSYNGTPVIYYRRSMDNGETWNTPLKLIYNASRKLNVYDAKIVVENSMMYLIWKDYRSGSSEVFLKKSSDNGDTWSVDQRVTFDYTPSYSPVFVVNERNLTLVFEEWGTRANLRLLRSIDQGKTWGEKIDVTDPHSTGDSTMPDLGVDETNLYLVWQEESQGKSVINFMKGDHEGKTWGTRRILSPLSMVAINPKLVVNKGVITVIWEEQHEVFDLRYSTSYDGGETWTEPHNITTGMDCYSASILQEADNVFLIWQVYHGPCWGDIYYMGNQSKDPQITSFSVNEQVVPLSGSVRIIIDGFDPFYNHSEVICEVAYLPPSDDHWYNLTTLFTGTHWEAVLQIDLMMPLGNYSLRTRLQTPDHRITEWRVLSSVQVVAPELTHESPGLDISVLLIAFICIIISLEVWHVFKKDRKN